MHRRDVLVGGAAALALSAPELARANQPETDLEAIQGRVLRLRTRMDRAAARTVDRYRRKMPGADDVPEQVWETIGRGFGAFSVLPSLRRMREDERAVPEVQSLLNDVSGRVGEYLLHVYDSLGVVLAHPEPAPRESLGRTLLGLAHHEEDEDFGRSTFVELRRARGDLRAELEERGTDGALRAMHARLHGLVEQARAQSARLEADAPPPQEPAAATPTDGKPVVSTAGRIARGLAVLLGAMAIGLAVVGAVFVVGGVLAMFSGGWGVCVGAIAVIGGGVIILLAMPLALGLLGSGLRPVGIQKSLDGKRLMASVEAKWRWFATGAVYTAERQPRVVVAGGVRVKGRLTAVAPVGLPGTQAGADYPAPGLPEYALVARIGDWTGLAAGPPGNRIADARREGELWLAVNVAESAADRTEGSVELTVFL